MTPFSPQQLVPVLSPDESISTLEQLLSPAQIRLLARIDGSSSISVLSTLLQIPLQMGIQEIKTLVARGILKLYRRTSLKEQTLHLLSWEQSMQELEALQQTLQGTRHHPGKTLVDVFAVSSSQDRLSSATPPPMHRVSVQSSKTPNATPVESPGCAPTRDDIPKIVIPPKNSSVSFGSIQPTPPMLKAFAENATPDEVRHHTLSSMELPVFDKARLVPRDTEGDIESTHPELPIVSFSSLPSVDAVMVKDESNASSSETVPAIDSATSWESIHRIDSEETSSSDTSAKPSSLPPSDSTKH